MDCEQAWFEKHWRRILVDIHIPDWDPSFLSKLRPDRYVDLMEAGGATNAMVYANSHVGLCNYPTKVGRMHQGLGGRDFFGEVVELCHKRGLSVVAYYSLIFNNWAYIEHPDWRTLAWGGWPQSGRYGTCCPNSPYREFALAQVAEICNRYDCDGIFFDMTFWPGVCYCPHCIASYRKEERQEPPRVVDWYNSEWVRFQRARERWLDEFAGVMTQKVRSVRPEMTVAHQFSTVLADWRYGVPFSLAEHCDYLSGDFYGESIQQSVVCKVFFSLSAKRPFEFHTSRCLDLTDHVTTKSPERLEAQAFVAPAHSSAFLFIDAIDPEGTLNAGTYRQIRSVFDKMAHYEPELGGQLCADVAVYFSQESKFNPVDNNTHITELKSAINQMPHWDAVLGSCRSLQQAHIPFGIVTKHNLSNLAKYQILVLPDVLVMEKNEIEAIRDFVSTGGSVYASYRTSIGRTDGMATSDFMLADVLGVSLSKNKQHGLTYFTPVDSRLKNWFVPQDHMIHPQGQVLIKVRTAEVLATRTVPYTDPDKDDIFGQTFSSIHSNPPDPAGTDPAIVFNKFGTGRVIYATGALESVDHDINRRVFVNLIRLLLYKPTWFEAQAHHAVEIILLHQADQKRMLISILNLQHELSGVPFGVNLCVRVPEGFKPLQLVRLPGDEVVPYSVQNGYVEARINGIDVFAMLGLEYQ